jgi:hypothetical protein
MDYLGKQRCQAIYVHVFVGRLRLLAGGGVIHVKKITKICLRILGSSQYLIQSYLGRPFLTFKKKNLLKICEPKVDVYRYPITSLKSSGIGVKTYSKYIINFSLKSRRKTNCTRKILIEIKHTVFLS